MTNIEAKVTFRGRSGLKAAALDLNGYVRNEVKVDKDGNSGSVITLPADTLYTIIEG